jgi:hypothetical protein
MVDTDYATAEQVVKQFISDFAPDRVYEWKADDRVNFGVLHVEGGIVENHYISVEVS